MEQVDAALLRAVQNGIPICARPYAALGESLGMSEAEVISSLQRLKVEGVLRRTGPIFEPASLGYNSTLVGMVVPEKDLDGVAEAVKGEGGISHAYVRAHEMNVWLTLSMPQSAQMEAGVRRIADRVGAVRAYSFPALMTYKLHAFFDPDGNSGEEDCEAPRKTGLAALSQTDRRVINAVQQDWPLTERPFESLAEAAGMQADALLDCCRSLLDRGIMRRFSATVSHTALGFHSNVMVCWSVSGDRLDETGKGMARCRAVSHCYARCPDPAWQYNLYTMIHGRTRHDCETLIGRVAGRFGITDRADLYTVKMLKKSRTRYAV